MNRLARPTLRPTPKVSGRLLTGAVLIVLVGVAQRPGIRGDEPAAPPRTPKEALAAFNPLVGEWRGVGMPRRGSRAGAWSETAEWVWEFEDGGVGIRYAVDDGKLLRSALLTYDSETDRYRLAGKFADGTERTYAGRLDGNKLVLESPPDEADDVHRLTITQLNEKRTLVLYEQRRQSSRFYNRVAEVGYTRQGTSLAEEGTDGPECVVTGGKGTIQVRHNGQTYWVCCTGCQQAFDDDPEGVLAEYRQKLAERKAAGKK